MKPAVVLLSGGLDSATTAAIARNEEYQVFALTFQYGQRHEIEVESARKIAKNLQLWEHRVTKIDLRLFGGSALTAPLEIPKGRVLPENGGEIPITYVPARNTIFLSYALAWAEVIGARDIFIGANAIDYSGYPDCRPEFIEQFERLANLATKAGISGEQFHVHAPLIGMTKAVIIRRGSQLGVDYSLTHSCYDPGSKGEACGECDSCLIRLKGFQEAGLEDPICYRQRSLEVTQLS